MTCITTIRRTDFEVVNYVGTVLATFGDVRLAFTRAKALAAEFGDLRVVSVTVREDRETVRRVKAPRDEAKASELMAAENARILALRRVA